jgi:hypothetical protein
MKLLVSLTKDNSSREFIELPYAEVLVGIKSDNGWHEVINMSSSENTVRLYFDIDAYNISKESVLRTTLNKLNKRLGCKDSDWAICDGSSGPKVSYHILSRKYKCRLSELRAFHKTLGLEWVDYSVYTFVRNEPQDQAYLRLPNQSKYSINQAGGPLTVLQGELSDFFIGVLDGLERCYFGKFNTSKCKNTGCNFMAHNKVTNNGGTHCCKGCKSGGNHGPLCEKRLYRQY